MPISFDNTIKTFKLKNKQNFKQNVFMKIKSLEFKEWYNYQQASKDDHIVWNVNTDINESKLVLIKVKV